MNYLAKSALLCLFISTTLISFNSNSSLKKSSHGAVNDHRAIIFENEKFTIPVSDARKENGVENFLSQYDYIGENGSGNKFCNYIQDIKLGYKVSYCYPLINQTTEEICDLNITYAYKGKVDKYAVHANEKDVAYFALNDIGGADVIAEVWAYASDENGQCYGGNKVGSFLMINNVGIKCTGTPPGNVQCGRWN